MAEEVGVEVEVGLGGVRGWGVGEVSEERVDCWEDGGGVGGDY